MTDHPGIHYILGFMIDARCIFPADFKSVGGQKLSVEQNEYYTKIQNGRHDLQGNN